LSITPLCTISLRVLAHVLRTHRFGELPPVLRPEREWLSAGEQREFEASANTKIAGLGILDRRGRIAEEVLDALAVLARPTLQYWAYFDVAADDRSGPADGDKNYRVLVATAGNEGVLAFRLGHAVELGRLYGEPPDSVLLNQLGRVPPARLDSLNVRVDGSGDGEQRRLLRRLAGQSVLGQGELYVGLRDPHGQFRANADAPVRFVDYPSGRVLVTCSAGYLSVLPATADLLAQRLAEARRLLTET